MMDLAALINELRVNRLDDTVERFQWSDEDLTGYLNDAVRQVCIRQRLLLESLNPAVCHYALTANVRTFKLHPAVLAVRQLRLTTADGYVHNHLRGMTLRHVHRVHPRWETWDAGRADFWIPDYQTGAIWLDRASDQTATVDLSVWRMPLEDEELDPRDMSSEPIIEPQYHMDLCDWAEYRAFSRKDAETLDTNRASTALATFDAKIGALPSAAAIRLWGVSPPMGVRAHYL